MSGKTSKGTPLTEELLDRLADEAEAGYAPEQLNWRRPPGRPRLSGDGEGPSQVLNVRIDDDLNAMLKERAERDGTSTSEITREALRRHLAS